MLRVAAPEAVGEAEGLAVGVGETEEVGEAEELASWQRPFHALPAIACTAPAVRLFHRNARGRARAPQRSQRRSDLGWTMDRAWAREAAV